MNDNGHSLTPPEPAAHPCSPFSLTAARRPVEAAGLFKQVLPPPHVAVRAALGPRTRQDGQREPGRFWRPHTS